MPTRRPFLLTVEQWEPQRVEFCTLVGKPGAAADALALADDELHTALADVETLLAQGGDTGQIRLTDDGELIIPQLSAEDVPAEADELRDEMAAMLPKVPFASVLVEVDARTGFLDHLVHAGVERGQGPAPGPVASRGVGGAQPAQYGLAGQCPWGDRGEIEAVGGGAEVFSEVQP